MRTVFMAGMIDKIRIVRVQQYISREASQINVQESRALHILVLIVSLLGEHFNFDQIREESDDLKTQLNSVSTASLTFMLSLSRR